MPESHEKKLGRLLRVRTLQLNQVRADEAAARARVDSEAQLRARIESLAANVAPEATASTGATMIAAAHYRERLHQSAFAADRRVKQAEQGLEVARAATREAKRDQSAVEKLIERAEAAQVLKAIRALEDLPANPRKRHDPC